MWDWMVNSWERNRRLPMFVYEHAFLVNNNESMFLLLELVPSVADLVYS